MILVSGIEQKVNRHINLTFIEFAVEWEENYRPQRESVLDLYGIKTLILQRLVKEGMGLQEN